MSKTELSISHALNMLDGNVVDSMGLRLSPFFSLLLFLRLSGPAAAAAAFALQQPVLTMATQSIITVSPDGRYIAAQVHQLMAVVEQR